MSDLELLQRRLAITERRVRVLGVVALLLGASTVMAALRPPEVLRARGLVIVDAAGRPRLVLGAPMREASDDPKLADAVGVAVLDSAGRLNTVLGASNPLVFRDGKMGKRIGASAGLTIYDPRTGGERGGIGAFADGRANVCLDYGTKDKEAACMTVAPGDQYAAVLLNGTPKEPQFDRVAMFVGADGSGVLKASGGGTNEGGVMLRAGKGAPEVAFFDSTGKPMSAPPRP